MTFRDLWLKTVRAAQNLHKRGYQPRQIFTFVAGNTENLTPIFFASICLGCTISPMHVMQSKEEIINTLKITKPSLIFCDIEPYNHVAQAVEELGLEITVFTLNGQTGNSKSVEVLFNETGNENDFV